MFPWQCPDLVHNHGKLLQGRDDDSLASLKRLLELTGGLIDILNHAQRLLELLHRLLELFVEHTTIRNDNDGIEDTLILNIMQHRELVSQPGDRITLAASRAMLDQVALSGPFLACFSD